MAGMRSTSASTTSAAFHVILSTIPAEVMVRPGAVLLDVC
jgi:hypothetical protein